MNFPLCVRNIYWTETNGVYVTSENVFMFTKTLQYSESSTFSPLGGIVVNPSNGSVISSYLPWICTGSFVYLWFRNKYIKKRIIKAVIVWSVALYAAETWTYRKEDIRRLEAFDMWVWKRMEKVSWRDMKTNEEVLQLVQEKRSLMDVI